MNDEPTWIGRTIGGRYQIESLLGQGGMSAVYKAFDPNLRRAVAVKIIHPHLSGERDFVRRFEEEAAAVAQLRHPNIIQVHDFNHEGNTYYIVFEYIPGESLQAWLRRLDETSRRMAFDEAIRIATSVADALEFAHEQGLIHRDVKPANVMINVRGQPILMDFGIAKIVGGTQHTATGAVLGTARYMSPEQIQGRRIDVRTDIYSLGVALFEMVSGRPPFEADSVMTMMMMHIQDPVPDLHQLRPDVPSQLAAVINTALEKEPEGRYQTAAEFAHALRQLDLNAPAAAPPPIKTEPAPTVETPPETAVPTDSSQTVPPPPLSETTTPPPQPDTAAKPWPKWLLVGGGAIAVLALIIFAITQLASPDADDGLDASLTQTAEIALIAEETAAAEETAVAQSTATKAAPTTAPTLTSDVPPTAPPTNAPPPTSTPLPSVHINSVTIEAGVYIVDYETIGYEPTNNGYHTHFYFNTVSQEDAGRPGSGPYEMYFSAPPFLNYAVSDRPEGATQLCAIVANPDHTIQFESGNCVDLPEPPQATPLLQPTSPPLPTHTPAPRVQIDSVTEDNGRYFINFQTFGYVPALPGVHVHFFFNTVAPENAGVPGNGPWKLYGGPSPFGEYLVSDRPSGATQMCALVANPDHSIRLDTGNCVSLP